MTQHSNKSAPLTSPDPAVLDKVTEVVKALSNEHPLGVTVTEEWVNIYTTGPLVEERHAGLLAAQDALAKEGLAGVLMALAIVAIEPLAIKATLGPRLS